MKRRAFFRTLVLLASATLLWSKQNNNELKNEEFVIVDGWVLKRQDLHAL